MKTGLKEVNKKRKLWGVDINQAKFQEILEIQGPNKIMTPNILSPLYRFTTDGQTMNNKSVIFVKIGVTHSDSSIVGDRKQLC